MSGREVKPLLEAIDPREQDLARQAEQTRTRIGELTATLAELEEAIAHLQITRTTLLSLAEEDEESAAPPPVLPDHPAYRRCHQACAMAATSDATAPALPHEPPYGRHPARHNELRLSGSSSTEGLAAAARGQMARGGHIAPEIFLTPRKTW